MTDEEKDERWRSPSCRFSADNAPCPKCWLAWFLPPPKRCDNPDHLEAFLRAELYRLRCECDEARRVAAQWRDWFCIEKGNPPEDLPWEETT